MSSEAIDGCLSEHDAAAYVEARLDDVGRARVEAHIDGCVDCRQLVSELARSSHPAAGGEPFLGEGDKVGRYEIQARLGSGGMGVVYVAYDPELRRKVALKVMGPGGDAEGRRRLVAEARAMASLAHPGVVPIYDVATIGEDVVLALELVDGQDAARWLRETRPGWQEALRVLGLAGRGLAAAHAAGLVHRDVKPANILVGKDGRARITDFGLVRQLGGDEAEELVGPPAVSHELTSTGALIGTPAYMAPEQHRGRPADARSDQFGWAVLLYEAVYGERPFAPAEGTQRPILDALAAEVIAGRVRPPPAGSGVPKWLRQILVRGLSPAPAERWPSVAAMLDALEETPRRRRRILAALGASTGAALVAAAFVLRGGTPAIDCDGAEALLEASWPAAERRAELTRLSGLGAYGQVLAPLLGAQLEDHAARWAKGYGEACRAHQRGAQSADLLDRRMVCLERSRAALPAVAEVLRLAEESTLPETARAVRAVPDPAACADLEALLAGAGPPPADKAADVAAVDAALARASVQLGAGHYALAHEQAGVAVARARTLGYRPLLARALLVEGRAAMHLDQRIRAAPGLAEAVTVAVEVGDDALAMEAWARAAWVKGTSGDPGSALAGLEIVEGLAARNPSAHFARALLENNVGSVELARGRRAEASARFDRALAEARHVGGPGAVELVEVRANAAMVLDDPERRDALLAEAEAELGRLYGADHPDALRFRSRRGMMIPSLAAARERLEPACAAFGRFQHVLAHASAVDCCTELGFVAEELGDHEAARAAVARAVSLAGGEDARVLEARAYLDVWRGEARRAAEALTRELEARPRRPGELWWASFERGKLGLALGRARIAAGDRKGGRRALGEALVDLDGVAKEHPVAVVERRRARARAELAAQGLPEIP